MTAVNDGVSPRQQSPHRPSPVDGTAAAGFPGTRVIHRARSDDHCLGSKIGDGDDGQTQLARLMEENAHLRAKLASLPIIEQAKGLLMGHYHVDAETAFALLRRWSSHTNLKLRELCRLLADAAAQPATPPPAGPASAGRSDLEKLLVAFQSGRRPDSGGTRVGHHTDRPTTTDDRRMGADLTAATDQDLLAELETVEQAIARSTPFHHSLDEDGSPRIRVSNDLLAWADREHHLVTELRRRYRMPDTSRMILATAAPERPASESDGAA